MEELKPGKVLIPSSMTSLIIVDNAVPQPNNVGHRYAVNDLLLNDTAFNTQPLSGLLISHLSDRLLDASTLNDVESFSNRTNLLSFIKDSGNNYPIKLSPEKLSEYSNSTSAQLLLSLDYLHVTSLTQLKKSRSGKSDATRDVALNSIWRLYDLKADTLMFTFSSADIMYWEKKSVPSGDAANRLPRFDAVLNEISMVFAETVAQQMLPEWVTVQRYCYANGSIRMRQAARYLQVDSLDKAAILWEAEYNRAIFRSKYRSAMNMILYYEAKGMPEVSLEWLDKAKSAMLNSPFGVTYIDENLLKEWKSILTQRIEEMEKLKF